MGVRYQKPERDIEDGIRRAERRVAAITKRLRPLKSLQRERTELRAFLRLAKEIASLGRRSPGMTMRNGTGAYLAKNVVLEETMVDQDGCAYVKGFDLFERVLELPGGRIGILPAGKLQDAEIACPTCTGAAICMVDLKDSSDSSEGTHKTYDFYAVCFHCLNARIFGRTGRGRRYRFQSVPPHRRRLNR